MNPSSYLLFARKCKGMVWTERFIARKFRKEVNKDDYAKTDTRKLIKELVSLSKVDLKRPVVRNA